VKNSADKMLAFAENTMYFPAGFFTGSWDPFGILKPFENIRVADLFRKRV